MFLSAQSQLNDTFQIINPCGDKHAWTETSPSVSEFAFVLICNTLNSLLGKQEMIRKNVFLVWILIIGNTIFCEKLPEKQKWIIQLMIIKTSIAPPNLGAILEF